MQAFFLVVLSLYSLVACSSKPYAIKPGHIGDAIVQDDTYVVSHGWHTGFVVPARDLNALIPALIHRFGEPRFYEVGWGDEGFYRAKEITFGLALQAAFWPTDTVLHVVALPQPPFDYFPGSRVVRVSLSRGQYDGLLRFIAQSFAFRENGEILPLSEGLYGNSEFYRAQGQYFLFNTCNSWTAKGLKSAGFDVTPAFKLTAGSVMTFLGGAENAFTMETEPAVVAREAASEL